MNGEIVMNTDNPYWFMDEKLNDPNNIVKKNLQECVDLEQVAAYHKINKAIFDENSPEYLRIGKIAYFTPENIEEDKSSIQYWLNKELPKQIDKED